ncbi:MAG: endolytic transglycosylase MltG, partial [Actinobacteria bacterium]|nr:endolytic transglycosylase MltG [Actinomycetota bacterium]
KVKVRAFVDKQLAAFEQNFAKVDMTRALRANLTPYDVVIIASMIDREALVPAERPLVAAVIWNRLRIDMLLQIDATIQYALGKTKPVLTFDDLKIDSPYNTYKHQGLPPTPISNPGLAALQAAAAPADVDYLYYVARNDGTGRHYFSKEYAQFLADQQKANANGQ